MCLPFSRCALKLYLNKHMATLYITLGLENFSRMSMTYSFIFLFKLFCFSLNINTDYFLIINIMVDVKFKMTDNCNSAQLQ
jgi:hypothetical protein